jgi:hypothetical protein
MLDLGRGKCSLRGWSKVHRFKDLTSDEVIQIAEWLPGLKGFGGKKSTFLK